jgi:hypothetical protein
MPSGEATPKISRTTTVRSLYAAADKPAVHLAKTVAQKMHF